jgi:hypothetical protein
MRKNDHRNIVDAISDLQARGFFLDFSLIGTRLLCAQQQRYLKAEEFEVREMYLFREKESSQRETIVLALESGSLPLKGILLKSGRRNSSIKGLPWLH